MKIIKMKYISILLSLIVFLVVSSGHAQVDSLQMHTDSLVIKEQIVSDFDSLPAAVIHNPEFLYSFLAQLHALDSLKDRKINIVHIGDSHIQADVMTDALRQNFQTR